MTTNTSALDHSTRRAPQGSVLDRVARHIVRSRLDSRVQLIEHGDKASRDGGIRVYIHDPAAYPKVLLGGSVGAPESYMDGDWTTNDLVGLCRLFARDDETLDSLEKGVARLAMPALKLFDAARRNTKSGSRRNIAAHYDLGNTFFAEWLDETMMYSSAFFENAGETLADASRNKIDRLCRKLDLRPSDHLLEIGTGWGGFAVHAAQEYGCRVTTATISREQFELATERVRAAGLSDRVTVLLEDYRDLRGVYDKLVSIEMIEAVGQEYLDTYFAKCASLLKPDGLFALQSILVRDQHYDYATRSVDFIKRYIFPGGSLPSMSVALHSATTAADFGLVGMEDITQHYALTLRRWRERFLERASAIRAQGFDDRFMRMWEFYLAYCEAGFTERMTTCAQILFGRGAFRSTVPGVRA